MVCWRECRCDADCFQCTSINEPCPVPGHNTCLWRSVGHGRFMYVYEYCLRLVGRPARGVTSSQIFTVPIRHLGICIMSFHGSCLYCVMWIITLLFFSYFYNIYYFKINFYLWKWPLFKWLRHDNLNWQTLVNSDCYSYESSVASGWWATKVLQKKFHVTCTVYML